MEKEKVIVLTQLEVAYGDKQVLKKVNLDVYRGEIVGYIGPNGAGKSTTIKVMLGLIKNYTGSVKLFGESIPKDDVNYKKRIGYVPERADMYEQLTPCEYLSFVGALYGLKEGIALEKGFQLLRVLGMEKAFHQRIDSFSKGMRQKVLIVSGLLHNPDIIFLDEPLNGLDTNSVSIMKQIFRKLADSGKTILFSSHIMEVVEQMCDRIVLLDNGNIVANGNVELLKVKYQQGTLEQVFNQLTSDSQQDGIANSFVDYVINEAEMDPDYA